MESSQKQVVEPNLVRFMRIAGVQFGKLPTWFRRIRTQRGQARFMVRSLRQNEAKPRSAGGRTVWRFDQWQSYRASGILRQARARLYDFPYLRLLSHADDACPCLAPRHAGPRLLVRLSPLPARLWCRDAVKTASGRRDQRQFDEARLAGRVVDPLHSLSVIFRLGPEDAGHTAMADRLDYKVDERCYKESECAPPNVAGPGAGHQSVCDGCLAPARRPRCKNRVWLLKGSSPSRGSRRT